MASFIHQDVIDTGLQSLIEGPRGRWTYAIFWQVSNNKAHNIEFQDPLILNWVGGYYQFDDQEHNEAVPFSTMTVAEQEHRKSIFHEFNFPYYVEETIPDSEWFFFVSRSHFFVCGSGLAGRALQTSTVFWVAGAEQLASSCPCSHGLEAQRHGIQTLVCIPLARGGGVVELGSTVLIPRTPESEFDLLYKVNLLFNFEERICFIDWDVSVQDRLQFATILDCHLQSRHKRISGSGSGPGPDSGSSPCPAQPGCVSESSVGNYALVVHKKSLISTAKADHRSDGGDSDNRDIEVFTRILRGCAADVNSEDSNS